MKSKKSYCYCWIEFCLVLFTLTCVVCVGVVVVAGIFVVVVAAGRSLDPSLSVPFPTGGSIQHLIEDDGQDTFSNTS